MDNMEITKVMVMMDSRGTDIEPKIKEDLRTRYPNFSGSIDITVRVMRGAKIENIVKKMDEKFKNYCRYDIIYVMVGVNNLTNKDKHGLVSPNYENVPDLIESLNDKMTSLKKCLQHRAKFVVICQIVGINIDNYNQFHNEGRWYFEQKVIDQAMPLLAHTINCINRNEKLFSPWLTNTIHEFVNHKLYHKYAKLRDGLILPKSYCQNGRIF